MNVFTVSFFGHRHISDPLDIDRQLEKILRELLRQKPYVNFLVGRDGEFDQAAASVIHRYKRLERKDNSALTWVMPYVTAEYRDNAPALQEYYDEIEVCEKSAATHYKASFQVRNRDIVDRSDLIIFYVTHRSGGAYQTMNYAKKHGKHIINLGMEDL